MTNIVNIFKKEPELPPKECVQKLEEELGAKCFIENTDYDPNSETSILNTKKVASTEFKTHFNKNFKLKYDDLISELKKDATSKLFKIPVLEDVKLYKNEQGNFVQPIFNQDTCYLYEHEMEMYAHRIKDSFIAGFKLRDGRITTHDIFNKGKLNSMFNQYFSYTPYNADEHYQFLKKPTKPSRFVYKYKDSITASFLFVNSDHYVLRSENPNYPDEIIPLNDEDFCIVGILMDLALSQSDADMINEK